MSTDQEIRARLRTSSNNVHLEALLRGEALRAVLDEHRPLAIYDECGHRHDVGEPGVHDVDNVGHVCDEGLIGSICVGCCTDLENYQTEECATAHEGPCYPCSTVRAIAHELGITQEET